MSYQLFTLKFNCKKLSCQYNVEYGLFTQTLSVILCDEDHVLYASGVLIRAPAWLRSWCGAREGHFHLQIAVGYTHMESTDFHQDLLNAAE